jgi:hypothetical protein
METPHHPADATSKQSNSFNARDAGLLWIDETHLLSPDGVIALHQNNDRTVTVSTKLPVSGKCVGSFPGGL